VQLQSSSEENKPRVDALSITHFNSEGTNMSNVYCLTGAKMDQKLCKLCYDFDSMAQWAFAKYGVDKNHEQASSIVESMNKLIRSRYKAHNKLYDQVMSEIHYGNPGNKLTQVRKALLACPRRVLSSFHNKIIKSDVDLKDPRTLAAFKAASEILDYFLQLEHDHMRAYLEATETHLGLQRARRRQQTLQAWQSKQECPQGVEGSR
jgi:hypothetical protein